MHDVYKDKIIFIMVIKIVYSRIHAPFTLGHYYISPNVDYTQKQQQQHQLKMPSLNELNSFRNKIPPITFDETYANSEQKCHTDKNNGSGIENKHTLPDYSFFEGVNLPSHSEGLNHHFLVNFDHI